MDPEWLGFFLLVILKIPTDLTLNSPRGFFWPVFVGLAGVLWGV